MVHVTMITPWLSILFLGWLVLHWMGIMFANSSLPRFNGDYFGNSLLLGSCLIFNLEMLLQTILRHLLPSDTYLY